MKIADIRSKTVDQLRDELADLRKEQFNLRFQRASGQLENVSRVRVVRRDIELTGLFDVISDSKAPVGLYGFDDAIDIDAWRKLGAEAIVKVAARADNTPGKIQVLGVAYFLNVGKDPVYSKKITIYVR